MTEQTTRPNSMLFVPQSQLRRRQLRISERRLLLMFGDTVAVLAAVLIALLVWSLVDPNRTFSAEFVVPRLFWFPVLVVLWLVIANANGFYDLSLAARRIGSLYRLLSITAQMLIVYLIVFFLSPDRDLLPRLFILYFGVAAFMLIALWRLVNPALIGWAAEARKVLIVGADFGAGQVIDAIREQDDQSYDIRGVIGGADQVGQHINDVPVIGTGKDLMNYVLRDRITELVVTSTRTLAGETFQAVMDAYERGVSIVPMPLLYERITGRVPVEQVDENWAVVLPIDGFSAFSPYATLKRVIEVIMALVGMVIFVALLPFLALAIKLDSPGPVFYSQMRVGLNGRHFRLYKFRTMRQDAERDTGAVFSREGDPRVTRTGRLMRRTRLDELPQLYNILRGDMSLIGPRPERPEHVERLQEKIPFYRTRHIIRPGLTGWAQVRYQYGATDEDSLVKLQYDLYYIRHQSVLIDLNILLRTVGRVVRMSGV